MGYGYGAITLCGPTFQKGSPSPSRLDTSPHTTFPRRSPPGIRFDLFRFYSPLLTESQLFSFPPPTEML